MGFKFREGRKGIEEVGVLKVALFDRIVYTKK